VVTQIWESRRFESIYTLQEKPNTHDTYASCTDPHTPLIHFLRAVPICGNLSRWPNRLRQIHCSREKVLPTPPLSPTEWPAGPTSVSLPNTTIEAVSLNQTFVNEQATRLTDPISPACDQYVQYLLAGANRSVHNWLRRGLQPWKCRFPHLTPRPSQLTVLHFQPKNHDWS
jgi:hypothetical protein